MVMIPLPPGSKWPALPATADGLAVKVVGGLASTDEFKTFHLFTNFGLLASVVGHDRGDATIYDLEVMVWMNGHDGSASASPASPREDDYRLFAQVWVSAGEASGEVLGALSATALGERLEAACGLRFDPILTLVVAGGLDAVVRTLIAVPVPEWSAGEDTVQRLA